MRTKKQRWRKTKPNMKTWLCDNPSCWNETKVYDSYKPRYCCDGYMCGCYGVPLNAVLCDDCAEQYYGITKKGRK